jgi:cbb3-type cytochrome oxidase subunit 3
VDNHWLVILFFGCFLVMCIIAFARGDKEEKEEKAKKDKSEE